MMTQMLRDEGFSLLELLVAVAILSLALIPMLGHHASALNSASQLKEKALAQLVAHNQVTRLANQATLPQIGQHQGDEVQGNVSFKWYATVNRRQASDLMIINVQVARLEGGENIAQLTGFRRSGEGYE